MSIRFPLLASSLLCTVLLGGCHSVKGLIPPNLRAAPTDNSAALKQAQKHLNEATPCCSNFADFSYRSMLPWQPKKFVLGPGSMVANLSGTHTYFLAFRLPSGAKLPYRIALKSELNGRWLHASYLFAPSVAVLDEGFQPIRTEDIGLCEHMGWGAETTGAFGEVTISKPEAHYLLVYSSAAQQSGKTYWEQSPATFSSSTKATLNMNSAGSFSVPHGPDGTIFVGVMNDTYASAVDNAICKKAKPGDGVINTLRTALPSIPWTTNKSDADNKSDTSNTAGKTSESP
ncbi:MAG: hypothetical protein ABI114_02905 [Rhodanobacter sp.]